MPIVYKITNTLNNKCYIGWTSYSLKKRWAQHVKDAISTITNRKFYNAIKKHGVDTWISEVLCEGLTKDQAKDKEIELIAYFNSYYQGYNSTKGGDGNNGIIMSKESNDARSNKLKGIPKNYNRMLGKKHSEESKRKMSDAHRGMKKPWVKWTEEQCKARGLKRRVLSEEQYKTMHILKSKGLTIKEISNEINISTDLAKKWLKMDW